MKCNTTIRFLRDIADIQTGPFGSQLHKEDYVEYGTPIVTVEHLGNRKFTEQNLPKVSDSDKERLKKYVLATGDIVFSRVGSVDRCSYVDEEHNGWMFSGRCLRVRPSENIDSLYLYYYFCREETRQFVRNIAVGATMPSINTKLLGEVPVAVPDLQIQKMVSNILSTIDNKIELNNKINANLQQQAQAIFKSWFVDFEPFQDGEFVESELGPIPKGWRVGELSEVATITMGQSPSGKSYNEEGNGSVFFQGRAEFGDRFPTRRLYTTEPKRMAEANSVLMSVRAPVGDINVAYEKCCIGRGLASIQSKFEYSSYMLYQMLSLKRQLDVFNGEGTVFGSINRDTLNAMKVLIPNEDSIEKFECTVAPMDKLVRANYDEICRLETARDTLLPKLMNGEIEVQ